MGVALPFKYTPPHTVPLKRNPSASTTGLAGIMQRIQDAGMHGSGFWEILASSAYQSPSVPSSVSPMAGWSALPFKLMT